MTFYKLPVHILDNIFFLPFAVFTSFICGLSPPLVLSEVLLFSLNKGSTRPFTPAAQSTCANLLSTFLLTKAGLTSAIQQNRRSVDYTSSGPSIPKTKLVQGSLKEQWVWTLTFPLWIREH